MASNGRLRRRAEFTRVYEQGARLRGRFMTCFALPNGLDSPRLGIAASRKIGNAVTRNRAKRRVRELYRAHKPLKPIDIVFVPRRELVSAPWGDLEADYHTALRRFENEIGSRFSRGSIS
jgi:ribonuclease P protein component